MPSSRSERGISRRSFLQATSLAAGGLAGSRLWLPALTAASASLPPLAQFGYGDVSLSSELGKGSRFSVALPIVLKEQPRLLSEVLARPLDLEQFRKGDKGDRKAS